MSNVSLILLVFVLCYHLFEHTVFRNECVHFLSFFLFLSTMTQTEFL